MNNQLDLNNGAKTKPDAGYKDPPYAFVSGNSLLALTKKHNVRRIAQLLHVFVLKSIVR